MKRIFLLRHGKAEPSAPGGDHERPLAPRGNQECIHMGAWMMAQGFVPNVALVSTAMRAQQSFERWSHGAQWEGRTETDRDLYLASATEICGRLQELDDAYSSVLLVGHNPGLEMAVRHLSEEFVTMRTATLSALSCEQESWTHAIGRGACSFQGLWNANDL